MIKDFRLALKMTREELADLAELDLETLQAFEERGFPGETEVYSIFLLAKALRVSVDTLVYFNDKYAR
ncbi:helix-turn-helix domain-containing protein [Natribacillus halophilus]|uniref:Helix-turn-helix n=1 Tax=Natribacillus halophilus TaxID=549003 RepID=A0A1G8LDX4_9BACI|nr:helix-turn-helix transcriptional regulator [Natribacillus halophilus]SDI53450.1 Helix-turn-helix [Natribacillus halophilus]